MTARSQPESGGMISRRGEAAEWWLGTKTVAKGLRASGANVIQMHVASY